MKISDIIGDLEGQASGPLYQKLHRALRQAIVDKRLAADDALPAERDIATDINVSRITVRKAIQALVDEGLVSRRHGAGTFITARVEKSFSKLSSFTEDMAARGWLARSAWLRRSEGTVTPEESLVLGLSPGSSVYRFHRIRYADDQPMAVETSTVPAYCLPSKEAVGSSLYEALEASGHRPVRALQRLRAVLFDDSQCELLGVEPGAPGLLIERRGFLPDGRSVELTQSWYRGDMYDFVAELNAGAA
ncbi:GntR family transcriptional regulator [Novosphingobium sp. FSW06-99]|uniref:GntR family transcriptional regulator n=1 Tax=Novosphingobium sp. FSW06-99 TaxID=1739113 RepID=UPI00076D7521|nr:GntR family transcriptional regulator [Novosphingobium sp. FSW06-99]KUR72089.1 GntR family transcriptional regulator [Novosphingobium sp. FSW06-99]